MTEVKKTTRKPSSTTRKPRASKPKSQASKTKTVKKTATKAKKPSPVKRKTTTRGGSESRDQQIIALAKGMARNPKSMMPKFLIRPSQEIISQATKIVEAEEAKEMERKEVNRQEEARKEAEKMARMTPAFRAIYLNNKKLANSKPFKPGNHGSNDYYATMMSS